MKKGKTVSTKRGRNFNILLTVVALVLIVAVGGFATYSWVEQATTLNIDMNGEIQRVPGDTEGRVEYHHQVSLVKGSNSEISLKNYLDKASDMMLSPVSSADGINFFMQKDAGNNSFIRSGSNSDRNVNYISFDFDVTSDTDTSIYFDDGNNSLGVEDKSGDYFKPSFRFGTGNELKSVRVAIQVNDGTPKIFSQTGEEYNAIVNVNSTNNIRVVTPEAFSNYIFGQNPIFQLRKDTKTKVRITIWLEGTDSNLNSEYVAGSPLNMKLMLTTPWSKATTVKLVDKTANSMFSNPAGKFYVYNSDGISKISDMNESDGTWTANIKGSQDNLTFKYVEGSTTYTWTASGRGDNLVYNVFDYASENGYGVWSPSPLQTETIDIKDCIVGTSLATDTNGDLDSHIKVSTDDTNYYRAAYNTTESKWYVNIDTNYSNLYVQYYSNGSDPSAKWNATEGRENKTTQTTYYLLDTDGKTTDYSTGSWSETYNIYFYDGTAQQITSKANTSIAYEAFSGKTRVSYGSVEKDTDTSAPYRFVAENQLRYTDKIDKVVFTLSRQTANDSKKYVTYTWNGDGKVNKDIYYTANSYTKD